MFIKFGRLEKPNFMFLNRFCVFFFLNRGSKIEIVAATLHILIFELYSDGINDALFSTELEHFMKTEQLKVVVDVSTQINFSKMVLVYIFLQTRQ